MFAKKVTYDTPGFPKGTVRGVQTDKTKPPRTELFAGKRVCL